MEKYFKEWNGKKFPVREVELPEELGGYMANIASISLWDAIEYAYGHEGYPNRKEAIGIDNGIYYYCEYGFIESDPTDEEIVEYLIKSGC